jgi:cell division protein FtsN
MRDLDKIRDKTVLALDTRQLFFLFFGGSVAAALLFALGVVVGRKLPPSQAEPEEDPLAVLDQLGAEEEDWSFQKGLKGRAAPPPPARPGAPDPVPPPSVAPPPPPAPPLPAPDPPPAKSKRDATREAPSVEAASGRYTLQLSSFQEKDEAAEFMQALAEKGYQTYLISAEVPGRGLWYRVRLGDYATHGDALEAKAQFERKQRIIAYVLRK